MFEVHGDNFVKSAMAVEVEVVGSPEQMHREDQPHQTKVMIAMKVRDKNVVDAVKVCLKAHQLHLCSFTTINEKMAVLDFHELTRRKSSVRRQCAA